MVGVKAFGRWVQRMECNGIRTDVPEQKTIRAFKQHVIAAVVSIAR